MTVDEVAVATHQLNTLTDNQVCCASFLAKRSTHHAFNKQLGPIDDSNLSLAERRPRRKNRRLPARFRDILPQPLPLLLPNAPSGSCTTVYPPGSPVLMQTRSSSPNSTTSITERITRLFRTPPNVFGLFRQYRSDRFPTHDPEEHLNVQDLLEDSPTTDQNPLQRQLPQVNRNNFAPYPNKNSFLLGDWYWNHGAQKSHESFRKLLDVVGDPQFRPDDVRHTPWNKIDAKLGANVFDQEDGVDAEESAEWLDEDAGWKKTPITIAVPFHHRSEKPGPQYYQVGHLYHRSLVSIIREKLADPHDAQHFHYEPFELFWQTTHAQADVRVHGELYTSPAFLDAHRQLQESPGEPGCNLQRVVVALMFWSDATHLTNFGTAKLWPCYLFFGNESKYRRCKPTFNLCNHVAYFQAVCIQFQLSTVLLLP